MNTQIDHLVVLADSLEQGAAWCEATLGVAPGAGGRHPLMGTHNRLLRIDGPGFAQAYLEVLAIDPEAATPARTRWFGLDDPTQRAALRRSPRLAQVVLRTTQIEMLRWGLVNLGQLPGEPLAAERQTPQGLLRWRILVRDDGRQGADGALPTLIEWQGTHPTEAMPPSALRLRQARLGRLAPPLRTLLRLQAATWDNRADAPRLAVVLDGPRGPVALHTD